MKNNSFANKYRSSLTFPGKPDHFACNTSAYT
jgi:hypothetical protein